MGGKENGGRITGRYKVGIVRELMHIYDTQDKHSCFGR